MSLSIFGEKEKPPSYGEIMSVIGEKRPLWEAIARFIEENYNLHGENKFYGKSSGWMVWFKKSSKHLIALYPQKNGFSAQIVLGPSLADKFAGLSLGKALNLAFESSRPYPEGRWLLVKVDMEDDVHDIEKLLMVKQPFPKAKRKQEIK